MNENEKILDILSNVLMNERLDELLQENEGYMAKQNQIDEAAAYYGSLEPSEEERRIVDDLISAYNAYSIFYAKMAYQQGVRDCVELLKEIGVV